MNKQATVFLVVVLAVALIGSVVLNENFADAKKKTKAELKAKIKALKAEIKALKANGVTSSEKKPLAAAQKALTAAEGQYQGLVGISQSNTQSQSSNCSTGSNSSSISNSCNNTQSAHNNNTGGIIVNGSTG